jgi:single-stranded-DNA-specific exonuclease
VKQATLASGYTLPTHVDAAAARGFGKAAASELRIPSQLAEILYQRGITTLAEVRDFLCPQLSMLPGPDSMLGMDQAVACVLEHCGSDKPIFIHGDYDVDGITATALLVAFFRETGMDAVHWYIPNRLEEKYGLSKGSIDRLTALHNCRRGGVLITVDCGISAIQEVAYARSIGLRVIVTDHHEPQQFLPDADAILNPKQEGCAFPFSQLSGAGVAFFFAMALRRAMAARDFFPAGTAPNLKKYLDLVALGTVADVVPLVGVNRILVRAGLEVLSAKDRYGVFSLCENCGLRDLPVQSEDIAFKLAPRINAAGRLGQPHHGVNLLLATSRDQAQDSARILEELNAERKQLELETLDTVLEKCEIQSQAGWSGLSVYDGNCHPGVVGILASRIVERFNKPAIVFTDASTNDAGQFVKGSGRSVPGTNLFEVLQRCSPWIEQFGGHAMAVGLTVAKAHLNAFAAAFHEQIMGVGILEGEVEAGRIRVDYHVQEISLLTEDFFRAVQLLQPYGEGNPEPVFLLTNERIFQPRNLKGHLSFQVRPGCNGETINGIGFHLWQEDLDLYNPVDLLFHLKRSWYRGAERYQMQALHIASP